jgi:hypothetical protein
LRGFGPRAHVDRGDHAAKLRKFSRLAQFSAAAIYGSARPQPLTDPICIHKIFSGSLCGARESVVTNPE